MRKNATIYLFNVTQQQNQETGERTKTIEGVIRVQGSVGPTGSTTYWQAQAANIELRGTILIQHRVYKKQQYLYFKDIHGQGQVYKRNSEARAEDEHLIKINYEDVKETDIKELIENVIQGL